MSVTENAISDEVIQKHRNNFYNDKKNVFAQNVCTKMDPFEVCLTRKCLEETSNTFDYKIENEAKPVTNQKSSGRCWIFAALNVMRMPFMKEHNIEDFEFSQAYLFFWDKVERCNFFLHKILEVCKRGEGPDGRLMAFLLQSPAPDGGQWDMLVNLVRKYGLMPKKCFPETFCTEMSSKVNRILNTKLREYAKAICDLIGKGGTEHDVLQLISDQMDTVFRIVGICLGVPPEKFTFNYYDKNKAFHSIGPITPLQFYNTIVKPLYDVENKVCLITDPRPTNEYEKCYTVDCLGNMVGGRRCIYNNQRVELLLELTEKSIKDGEAVWFGCEVSKKFAMKQGIMDLHAHDFPLVFGVEIQDTIPKADRLVYGDSAMSHAMVFTGIGLNENSKVSKLRVENSWGEERGDKGYLIMTKEWFNEFVFEVVVDRKYVPPEVLTVFDLEPIVLPGWDPMGTLATARI